MKNDLLMKCEVKNGRIVLSVGMESLVFATENHPDMQDEKADPRYKVSNPEEWMRNVAMTLNEEREDGSSFITDMFDKAIYESVEQGYEGVDDVE